MRPQIIKQVERRGLVVSDHSEEVQEVYYKLLDVLNDLVSEYDPLIVAGCMVAQGLGVYRTALSEDDFVKIINGIVSKKDEVRAFGGGNLH